MISKLQTCTNIAILLVAGMIGVQVYRGASTNAKAGNDLKPGARLALPGLEWNRTQMTLLFVLSPECHFCSESAPFYRRLIGDPGLAERLRYVAVLPSSIADSTRYLNSLNVKMNDVRQFDFALWGVPGTPTIILLDRDGKAQKFWVGKLSPIQEEQVIGELGRL